MKKFISTIKTKLKDTFTNNDKLAVLSLSLIVLSIFLITLASITVSSGLQNQRLYLGGFFLAGSFYLIPISNMKQKDKFMLEFGLLCANLMGGLLICIYWIKSLDYNKYPLYFDIILSVLSVVIIYYFLYKVFQIIKIFIIFINKLTTKIFPNSKSTPNGFKFIFERFTAILISVSGALATVLATATSFKALIDIFQK